MRKVVFIANALIFFCVLFSNKIYSATVSGTPIQTTDSDVNDWINVQWNNALTTFNDENSSDIARYDEMTKMASSFINANSFSTFAGTLQGYRNYQVFAVSLGFVLAEQFPNYYPPDYKFSNIENNIIHEGDGNVALSGSGGLNLGLNLNRFMPLMPKGLYGDFKMGYARYGINTSNLGGRIQYYSFENITLGAGANYAIVPPSSRWRGISIGSGLIYQKNEIIFDVEMDPYVSNEFNNFGYTFRYIIKPTTRFKVDVETFTIPLDAVTSFQPVRFLNLTAGAGMDIIYGIASMKLSSVGSMWLEGSNVPDYTPGTMYIKNDTKEITELHFYPRIMTGIGVNIFWVKLDIPVIFYIGERPGIVVGLTAGVV